MNLFDLQRVEKERFIDKKKPIWSVQLSIKLLLRPQGHEIAIYR